MQHKTNESQSDIKSKLAMMKRTTERRMPCDTKEGARMKEENNKQKEKGETWIRFKRYTTGDDENGMESKSATSVM